MGIALKLCYYPWITQYIPPEEIYKQIGVLAQETGKELSSLLGESANIEVLKPVEVPEQIRMIVARECNIALMNPLGYVFANSRNKSVRAQVVALREIGSEEFSEFVQRPAVHPVRQRLQVGGGRKRVPVTPRGRSRRI